MKIMNIFRKKKINRDSDKDILINDSIIHIPEGAEDISIMDGKIFINNKEMNIEGTDLNKSVRPVINVIIEGNAGCIECNGSVKVRGNVNGIVDCGGSFQTDSAMIGNIHCGGSVEINGDIYGDIESGGNVTVNGHHAGYINAKGSVFTKS